MAKEFVCIDTDVCVDFLRKRNPGFSLFIKILKGYEPCMTAITAYELYLGHMKMKRKDRIDDFIYQFVILPFDLKASEVSANIESSLDRKGKGIGIPDTLIAGICISNNVPLLTINTMHFSRVNPVRNSSGALASQALAQRVKPRRNYLKSNPSAEQRGIISNGVNGLNLFSVD
jgi:tRNA(fMet)-specific endonuclease VapC